MICIDVGSGYNPKKGYLTCDSNYSCDFYSIDDIPDNVVHKFHIRNVLHHIQDIEEFIWNIKIKCINGCIIHVEDCSELFYTKNLCLDILWYRFILNRHDIYIHWCYRNFINIFKTIGFDVIDIIEKDEKIIAIFKLNKLEN